MNWAEFKTTRATPGYRIGYDIGFGMGFSWAIICGILLAAIVMGGK